MSASAPRYPCELLDAIGKLDDEGRLTITGRKKLLIEVGGYKVDPIEVEDVVVAHPKVGEAVVVGVPGKVAGEEVVKAVVVFAVMLLQSAEFRATVRALVLRPQPGAGA